MNTTEIKNNLTAKIEEAKAKVEETIDAYNDSIKRSEAPSTKLEFIKAEVDSINVMKRELYVTELKEHDAPLYQACKAPTYDCYAVKADSKSGELELQDTFAVIRLTEVDTSKDLRKMLEGVRVRHIARAILKDKTIVDGALGSATATKELYNKYKADFDKHKKAEDAMPNPVSNKSMEKAWQELLAYIFTVDTVKVKYDEIACVANWVVARPKYNKKTRTATQGLIRKNEFDAVASIIAGAYITGKGVNYELDGETIEVKPRTAYGEKLEKAIAERVANTAEVAA